MENSFDNAHIAFVHRASFGDQARPEPAGFDLTMLADGFVTNTSVPVVNSDLQKANLRINSDETVRHMQGRWYMPFTRKLRITYPNGLVHSIVTAATPIDDGASQIVQFCFRSDSEADAPAADIIKFDRQVTNEDRYILESSDFDVPLDQAGAEFSMGSDRPGVTMRRMLRDLLAAHGESETRLPAAAAQRQAALAASR
jgi:phenylpropionate dioxygenase-like ring-hydroxylating dioxygenase large terminal subunit